MLCKKHPSAELRAGPSVGPRAGKGAAPGVNYVLRVCVKDVSHLRRFGFLVGNATQRLPFDFAQGRRTGLVYAAPPALERKTWRDSGAMEAPAAHFLNLEKRRRRGRS